MPHSNKDYFYRAPQSLIAKIVGLVKTSILEILFIALLLFIFFVILIYFNILHFNNVTFNTLYKMGSKSNSLVSKITPVATPTYDLSFNYDYKKAMALMVGYREFALNGQFVPPDKTTVEQVFSKKTKLANEFRSTWNVNNNTTSILQLFNYIPNSNDPQKIIFFVDDNTPIPSYAPQDVMKLTQEKLKNYFNNYSAFSKNLGCNFAIKSYFLCSGSFSNDQIRYVYGTYSFPGGDNSKLLIYACKIFDPSIKFCINIPGQT